MLALNLDPQTMHLALLMNHHQGTRKHRWQLCRTKQRGGRRQIEGSRDTMSTLMVMRIFWGWKRFDTTLSEE
jgi:hypothetical protein